MTTTQKRNSDVIRFRSQDGLSSLYHLDEDLYVSEDKEVDVQTTVLMARQIKTLEPTLLMALDSRLMDKLELETKSAFGHAVSLLFSATAATISPFSRSDFLSPVQYSSKTALQGLRASIDPSASSFYRKADFSSAALKDAWFSKKQRKAPILFTPAQKQQYQTYALRNQKARKMIRRETLKVRTQYLNHNDDSSSLNGAFMIYKTMGLSNASVSFDQSVVKFGGIYARESKLIINGHYSSQVKRVSEGLYKVHQYGTKMARFVNSAAAENEQLFSCLKATAGICAATATAMNLVPVTIGMSVAYGLGQAYYSKVARGEEIDCAVDFFEILDEGIMTAVKNRILPGMDGMKGAAEIGIRMTIINPALSYVGESVLTLIITGDISGRTDYTALERDFNGTNPFGATDLDASRVRRAWQETIPKGLAKTVSTQEWMGTGAMILIPIGALCTGWDPLRSIGTGTVATVGLIGGGLYMWSSTRRAIKTSLFERKFAEEAAQHRHSFGHIATSMGACIDFLLNKYRGDAAVCALTSNERQEMALSGFAKTSAAAHDHEHAVRKAVKGVFGEIMHQLKNLADCCTLVARKAAAAIAYVFNPKKLEQILLTCTVVSLMLRGSHRTTNASAKLGGDLAITAIKRVLEFLFKDPSLLTQFFHHFYQAGFGQGGKILDLRAWMKKGGMPATIALLAAGTGGVVGHRYPPNSIFGLAQKYMQTDDQAKTVSGVATGLLTGLTIYGVYKLVVSQKPTAFSDFSSGIDQALSDIGRDIGLTDELRWLERTYGEGFVFLRQWSVEDAVTSVFVDSLVIPAVNGWVKNVEEGVSKYAMNAWMKPAISARMTDAGWAEALPESFDVEDTTVLVGGLQEDIRQTEAEISELKAKLGVTDNEAERTMTAELLRQKQAYILPLTEKIMDIVEAQDRVLLQKAAFFKDNRGEIDFQVHGFLNVDALLQHIDDPAVSFQEKLSLMDSIRPDLPRGDDIYDYQPNRKDLDQASVSTVDFRMNDSPLQDLKDSVWSASISAFTKLSPLGRDWFASPEEQADLNLLAESLAKRVEDERTKVRDETLKQEAALLLLQKETEEARDAILLKDTEAVDDVDNATARARAMVRSVNLLDFDKIENLERQSQVLMHIMYDDRSRERAVARGEFQQFLAAKQTHQEKLQLGALERDLSSLKKLRRDAEDTMKTLDETAGDIKEKARERKREILRQEQEKDANIAKEKIDKFEKEQERAADEPIFERVDWMAKAVLPERWWNPLRRNFSNKAALEAKIAKIRNDLNDKDRIKLSPEEETALSRMQRYMNMRYASMDAKLEFLEILQSHTLIAQATDALNYHLKPIVDRKIYEVRGTFFLTMCLQRRLQNREALIAQKLQDLDRRRKALRATIKDRPMDDDDDEEQAELKQLDADRKLYECATEYLKATQEGHKQRTNEAQSQLIDDADITKALRELSAPHVAAPIQTSTNPVAPTAEAAAAQTMDTREETRITDASAREAVTDFMNDLQNEIDEMNDTDIAMVVDHMYQFDVPVEPDNKPPAPRAEPDTAWGEENDQIDDAIHVGNRMDVNGRWGIALIYDGKETLWNHWKSANEAMHLARRHYYNEVMKVSQQYVPDGKGGMVLKQSDESVRDVWQKAIQDVLEASEKPEDINKKLTIMQENGSPLRLDQNMLWMHYNEAANEKLSKLVVDPSMLRGLLRREVVEKADGSVTAKETAWAHRMEVLSGRRSEDAGVSEENERIRELNILEGLGKEALPLQSNLRIANTNVDEVDTGTYISDSAYLRILNYQQRKMRSDEFKTMAEAETNMPVITWDNPFVLDLLSAQRPGVTDEYARVYGWDANLHPVRDAQRTLEASKQGLAFMGERVSGTSWKWVEERPTEAVSFQDQSFERRDITTHCTHLKTLGEEDFFKASRSDYVFLDLRPGDYVRSDDGKGFWVVDSDIDNEPTMMIQTRQRVDTDRDIKWVECPECAKTWNSDDAIEYGKAFQVMESQARNHRESLEIFDNMDARAREFREKFGEERDQLEIDLEKKYDNLLQFELAMKPDATSDEIDDMEMEFRDKSNFELMQIVRKKEEEYYDYIKTLPLARALAESRTMSPTTWKECGKMSKKFNDSKKPIIEEFTVQGKTKKRLKFEPEYHKWEPEYDQLYTDNFIFVDGKYYRPIVNLEEGEEAPAPQTFDFLSNNDFEEIKPFPYQVEANKDIPDDFEMNFLFYQRYPKFAANIDSDVGPRCVDRVNCEDKIYTSIEKAEGVIDYEVTHFPNMNSDHRTAHKEGDIGNIKTAVRHLRGLMLRPIRFENVRDEDYTVEEFVAKKVLGETRVDTAKRLVELNAGHPGQNRVHDDVLGSMVVDKKDDWKLFNEGDQDRDSIQDVKADQQVEVHRQIVSNVQDLPKKKLYFDHMMQLAFRHMDRSLDSYDATKDNNEEAETFLQRREQLRQLKRDVDAAYNQHMRIMHMEFKGQRPKLVNERQTLNPSKWMRGQMASDTLRSEDLVFQNFISWSKMPSQDKERILSSDKWKTKSDELKDDPQM